jgi:hemolysin activation/secretion protein
VDRPFQLLLGGPTGVRGYREWDFPAARRLLLGVEDRFSVPWPAQGVVDLGFTLFADAGRGWAGHAPAGVDSGWKGAVGAGLRLGFPAGSQSVVRLDVAFPLGADTSPGDWVVRMSLGDLLGLAAGLENRQLARSRRVTVGPDLFTRSR